MVPEWTLFHLLQNAAERAPDQLAIVDDDKTSHTWAQLHQASARLAHCLRAHRLQRGDRLGVYVEKSFEALVAMTACAHAGAVFVNINPLLKGPQVRHILENCGARHLIIDGDKLTREALPAIEVAYVRGKLPEKTAGGPELVALDEIFRDGPALEPRARSTESDLATIIYTSGSTGLPKGIMLSHHNVVVGAQIVSTYLENTAADRLLSLLPLTFDVGMNQFTTMLRVGGTLVLQRSMLPGDTLANLRQERITGLAGVPSVWALVLQNKKSLQREPLTELRYLSNTGGTIPSTHLELLRAVFPTTKIFLMYGLTEAFRSTFLPPSEVGRGAACIGKAIPDTDAWVVRPDGTETADDEEGELVHRGPTIALGYWGDPEKTRSVYRVNPFAPPELNGADVVVYSGDVVRRDAEGFLHYVGRRDEQIKTQGYRVSPLEIEELLYGTGRVHEAAAFGKKDELLGQRIVAICSLREGTTVTAEELRQLVSTRAPSHLVPQELHIVADLPKNSNGKTDRSLLRSEYAR